MQKETLLKAYVNKDKVIFETKILLYIMLSNALFQQLCKQCHFEISDEKMEILFHYFLYILNSHGKNNMHMKYDYVYIKQNSCSGLKHFNFNYDLPIFL